LEIERFDCFLANKKKRKITLQRHLLKHSNKRKSMGFPILYRFIVISLDECKKKAFKSDRDEADEREKE
jgi:hypothetical protein